MMFVVPAAAAFLPPTAPTKTNVLRCGSHVQFAIMALQPTTWGDVGPTNRAYRQLAARQGVAFIQCGQVGAGSGGETWGWTGERVAVFGDACQLGCDLRCDSSKLHLHSWLPAFLHALPWSPSYHHTLCTRTGTRPTRTS